MIFHSLLCNSNEWRVGQLEVSLLPGLPALHIIGLKHRAQKELLPKFKAAFRAQGMEWPRTKQVVIQVRPVEWGAPVGIELAVAAAVAIATGQQKPLNLEDPIFCGDITLEGEVVVPEKLLSVDEQSWTKRLVGGAGDLGYRVSKLSEFGKFQMQHAPVDPPSPKRPEVPPWNFSEKAAELLKIVALGEHSVLLAGPPGTGKTTWIDTLWTLLGEPSREEWRRIWRQQKSFGEDIKWRPKIEPHHSCSSLAILGGGIPPSPGEITRAHGGMLFLDEYLEFSTRVQEGLREPIERGRIRVARGPRAKEFPSEFLLVAATNLCSCGRLCPTRDYHCQFTIPKCSSVVRRMSGPMLDRFHLLVMSGGWGGERRFPAQQLLDELNDVRAWRLAQGFGQVSARADLEWQRSRLSPVARMSFPDDDESERRRIATLRIASTIADLDKSKLIEAHHVGQAKTLTLVPYKQLDQLFA